MPTITVPHNFSPRSYQLPILKAIDSGFLRIIQVWHRRAGKEKVDINIVAKKMLEKVGAYYYFFPTYTQGKKILWDGADKSGVRFIDHFPKELIDGKPNETEMKLRFKNGSLFQVVGADKIDSIVGTNPIGTVWSEYSVQNPKGWDYIRPILAENGGWAIFNWTPRGKNHAFDLHEMAKDDPKWFVSVLTVDDTRAISTEVLEQERKEIIAKHGDDALFRQEYYCSYTASILGAYYGSQYAIAEANNRFTEVPYDPLLPVHTVWDLGISDVMAIGFYQAVGSERRKIDYEEYTGLGFPQVIKELKNKPYVYGKHFAPHDIKVRELSTGKTRWDSAKELGVEFEIVPSVSVQDGIDQGRAVFSKLWVDKTKCAQWLKLIPQYTKEYDENKHMFKDTPLHDWTSHGCFSAGTKILTKFGLKNIEKINIGEILVTPFGETEVLDRRCTGKKNVYDFFGTKVTHNHPFLTQRGYISLDELRYSDSIVIWKEKQSQLMGLNFIDTHPLLVEKIGIIIKGFLRGKKSVYIDIYGKKNLEKYPKIFMYIIRMVMYLITILKTWKQSQFTTILVKNMDVNQQKQEKEQFSLQSVQQSNGINPLKVDCGMENKQKNDGKEVLKKLKKFVGFVTKNLSRLFQREQNGVRVIAKLHLCGEEEVYNLVTKNGTYVADGIAVSNSDEFRYFALVEDQMTNGGSYRDAHVTVIDYSV